MSTPRDPDEFDDRRDDVPGWHEPAHLGGEQAEQPPAPVEAPGPRSRRGSLGTGGMWRLRGDVARVFANEADVLGAQGWALSHGWSVSDGTGPEDAGLQDLIASAPVRATKEHRAGSVLRGRGGALELVAFDARWVLLAAEDDPRLRRLIEDPTVQGLLLGSDDGDEFWSAAGHVAVIRPDGHRPQLIEHHARLLGAVVPALTAGC